MKIQGELHYFENKRLYKTQYSRKVFSWTTQGTWKAPKPLSRAPVEFLWFLVSERRYSRAKVGDLLRKWVALSTIHTPLVPKYPRNGLPMARALQKKISGLQKRFVLAKKIKSMTFPPAREINSKILLRKSPK